MKKGLLLGSVMLVTFGLVGTASASLVKFDLAGGLPSEVNIYNTSLVTGALASSLDQKFALNDLDTKTVDFFMLTASRPGLSGYQVMATLAFDAPDMDPASAEGEGLFSGGPVNGYGYVTAGSIHWFAQPEDVVLADGNIISVSFEDGDWISACGNQLMVHATITNLGGGIDASSPVPEPATMFLFGTGLVGFAGFTMKRKNK